MITKTHSTTNTSIGSITETIEAVRQDKMSFIIYFVSDEFNFDSVTKEVCSAFPNVPSIGCVSTGEFYPSGGYIDSSFTISSIYSSDFNVTGLLLTDLQDKVMLYKRKILSALEEINIGPGDYKKLFIISIIDAFVGCEDRIGTMLRNVFKTTDINLAGGSAGNLSKGKGAYVAINGEISDNACALLFVHTNKKIFTYNENIYKPIGDMYRVTKSDFETRTIYEANNQPFVDLYCKNTGVAKSDLNLVTFSKNPIGRSQGDKTYISSPLKVNSDNSMTFYSRVLTGRQFYFMESKPLLETTKETVDVINNEFKNVDLIIGFNCILRYLQMSDEKINQSTYSMIANGTNSSYIGFTTLGEQIGTQHVNQTLTILAIGD